MDNKLSAEIIYAQYKDQLMDQGIPVGKFELMAKKGADPVELETSIKAALNLPETKEKEQQDQEAERQKCMQYLADKRKEITAFNLPYGQLELLIREGATLPELQSIVTGKIDQAKQVVQQSQSDENLVKESTKILDHYRAKLKAAEIPALKVEKMIHMDKMTPAELEQAIEQLLEQKK